MSTSTTRTTPREEGRASDGPARPDGQRAAALPAGPSRGPATERARHGIAEAVRDLRFITDRPPCLLEHLAYARRGEWTDELDGPLRVAAVVYAWTVAIPLSVTAYLLAWCAARPARFATALVLWITVASALARVPGVGALIPGWSHW